MILHILLIGAFRSPFPVTGAIVEKWTSETATKSKEENGIAGDGATCVYK